ncbi:hypothetical protein CENTIMANUS_00120 [Klebsiella phage vB_KpM_Centimanus]
MEQLISLGKFVSAFNLSGSVSDSNTKRIVISVTDNCPPGAAETELTEFTTVHDLTGLDHPFNPELQDTLDNLYCAGVRKVKSYELVETVNNYHRTRLFLVPMLDNFDYDNYLAWVREDLVNYAFKMIPDLQEIILRKTEPELPDDNEGDRYEPAVNVSGFRNIAKAFGFRTILASRLDLGGYYSGIVFRLALN